METLPLGTFKPQSYQIFPANQKMGGLAGLTLPGPEADWSGGGWWVVRMGNFLIPTLRIQQWDALMMRLRSGVTEFIVPLIRPEYLHTNTGEYFCGGGALRATQMNIASNAGQTLLGGEWFSYTHANAGMRAYCIETAGPKISGQQLCTFGPPLREAIVGSAVELDFRDPGFVAKVTSPPEESWANLVRPMKARPNLNAVESFKYLESLS